MRVLVTGGAGYIGSVTTRWLLDAGHECVVLDNLERGWREAVDPRAEFVHGSVGDRGVVATALAGCDAVVHAAGLIEVAESQLRPGAYYMANAIEPREMLDAMIDTGVKAIVYSSTAAVYGQPTEVPIREDAPTQPVNVYGDTKLAFERALEEYAEQGIASVRFRYFNVAGAWPDGSMGEAHEPETHLIPRILGAMREGQRQFEIYGDDYGTRDGTCVRDYIHVCDLAEAHRLGLEALKAGLSGGVFNLGSGSGFSNLEVVRTCSTITGSEVDIVFGKRRDGDPEVLIASPDKAETELGWSRERGELATIVEDAWRWHLAHPNGYR